MSLFQKATLFFVCLGVFFILFNISIKKREQLTLCKHYQVKQIELFQSGEKIEIKKETNEDLWQIYWKGHQSRAHQSGVDMFTKVICYLPFVDKFNLEGESTTEKLEPYGLTEEAKIIRAKIGDESLEWRFGTLIATGTEIYHVNSKEPDVIYTIPNSFDTMTSPSFMDLIMRIPFIDMTSGNRVKINYDSLSFLLTKNGDHWIDENNILSSEQSNKLLDILKHLNFEKFKGPLSEDEKYKYPIDYPDIEFEWEKPDHSIEKRSLILLSNGYFMTHELDGELYLLLMNHVYITKLVDFLDDVLKSKFGQEALSHQ